MSSERVVERRGLVDRKRGHHSRSFASSAWIQRKAAEINCTRKTGECSPRLVNETAEAPAYHAGGSDAKSRAGSQNDLGRATNQPDPSPPLIPPVYGTWRGIVTVSGARHPDGHTSFSAIQDACTHTPWRPHILKCTHAKNDAWKKGDPPRTRRSNWWLQRR